MGMNTTTTTTTYYTENFQLLLHIPKLIWTLSNRLCISLATIPLGYVDMDIKICVGWQAFPN
jgi:hypothetical protein